jgi:hypothetical protein
VGFTTGVGDGDRVTIDLEGTLLSSRITFWPRLGLVGAVPEAGFGGPAGQMETFGDLSAAAPPDKTRQMKSNRGDTQTNPCSGLLLGALTGLRWNWMPVCQA